MTSNAPASGMRQLAGTIRVSQIRIISAAIAIVLTGCHSPE